MRILDGYTPFHKTVVIMVWAVIFGALVRAGLLYGGGAFLLEEKVVIDTSAHQLWPWIYQTKNRERWTVYMRDSAILRGAPDKAGSARMLFHKKKNKRWSVVEVTQNVLMERIFETYQESKLYNRSVKMVITPLGACQSELHFTEVTEYLEFGDRFWYFIRKGDEEERLSKSLVALDRWAEDTAEGDCALKKTD